MDHTAQQIMSKKLLTVKHTESMSSAHQTMRARGIRHLPVTDTVGEIIGIISDRDVCRAMTPTFGKEKDLKDDVQIDPEIQVKDFMSWPIRTVSTDMEVGYVAKLMLDEKISAFLVVDEHRQTRGIVTTDDMLRLLIKLLDKGPGELKLTLGSVLSDFSMSPGAWV